MQNTFSAAVSAFATKGPCKRLFDIFVSHISNTFFIHYRCSLNTQLRRFIKYCAGSNRSAKYSQIQTGWNWTRRVDHFQNEVQMKNRHSKINWEELFVHSCQAQSMTTKCLHMKVCLALAKEMGRHTDRQPDKQKVEMQACRHTEGHMLAARQKGPVIHAERYRAITVPTAPCSADKSPFTQILTKLCKSFK